MSRGTKLQEVEQTKNFILSKKIEKNKLKHKFNSQR